MSAQPPPPPPVHRRSTLTPGPALTLLGAAVAGTALFGLPLAEQNRFGYTDYTLMHSVASYVSGRPGGDLFNGFAAWWDWGRITFAALVLVLSALLVLGVATRVLGIVTAVVALAFGVVDVIALANTPTYLQLQQMSDRGSKILGNASYGIWVGLIGLAVLVAGAVLTAVHGRPRAMAPAYPQTTYPPAAPYQPASDQPAKQL